MAVQNSRLIHVPIVRSDRRKYRVVVPAVCAVRPMSAICFVFFFPLCSLNNCSFFCVCVFVHLPTMFSQEGCRCSATNPVHGHPQANPDASKIGYQHPKDYAIHENGIRSQIRARWTGAASGPSLWRRRHGKSYAYYYRTTKYSRLVGTLFIPQAFYEKSGAIEGASSADDNKMIVAISSDRGLCGAVHTNVAKSIRNQLSLESPDSVQTKVFCIGDKSRALLQRYNMTVLIKNIYIITSI